MAPSPATTRKLFLFTVILAIITISSIQYSYAQSVEHVLTFGSGGTGNGNFSNPIGLTTNGTHLFVADFNADRIQIFDTNGNYVSQFGSSGSGAGQLNGPIGIAVTSMHIFVADLNNDRVQIFDIDGNFVKTLGSSGSGAGQLNGPIRIITNNTHLFVADSSNHRIQIFDIDGNFVKTFGSEGTGAGQFSGPNAMTTNGTHLFVTDLTNNRVQIFYINGTYVSEFGGSGTGAGKFNSPRGLTTNGTHLFVSDTLSHRIQIFDINGNYLSQFGSSGSANGKFGQPRGITTNSTHLFVAETINNRVQVFEFTSIVACTSDQIRLSTGCVSTTPIITVGGSSENRTVTAITGISYTVPAGAVTDDNASYSGTVTPNPSTINTTSTGTFTIRYTAPADASGNIPVPVVLTVHVIDTTPVITVGGSSENRTITVVTGTSYTVPAGVVTDNDDNYNGTVTPNPSTINTTSPGTFTIRYTAPADVSGNIPVPVVFTVHVIDTTPVITVGGSSENQTISVEVGTSYTVPAGVVTDNDDNYNETVTANPSTIVTTSPGTFTIRYTAPADVSGNIPIPVVLTVNVTDTIPPVITVAGSSNNRTISIPLNQLYLLPNSTITDVDTAYTGSVTVTVNGEPFDVSTPLDTSSAGTFTVRYTANADASGNAPNPVVLTIHVTQCTPPEIFDGTSCALPQFNHVLSLSGAGANSFRLPIGITTTSTNIFIVDTLNHRVQVYDHTGNYVSQFGSQGDANGQFAAPVGITTNGTHIFVADNGNHRVQIFDYSGNHVKTFGTKGSGNGQFTNPQNILTTSTHIYITDANNHRVQVFDHTGNYISQFGESGTGAGQFNNSRGITTNGINLFVTDTNNDRVQIWDFNGNYIKSFGIQGHANGLFNSPRAITSTDTNLYVVDAENHRVQVYDFSGNFITQFGDTTPSSADGRFNTPRGITTNDTHLYIADSGNNRIQVFEIPSSLMSESCPVNQVSSGFGTCIADTQAPVIATLPPVSVLQNSMYRPSATATDNDPNFNGFVRSSGPNLLDTGLLDTSSVGSFTITYVATDPSGSTGTASQVITVIAVCPAGQIPNSAGVFCISDTMPPVIIVDGSSDNRAFKIADNNYYLLPTPFVTDNDPAYSGTVTVTIDGNPFDVTTPLNHAEGSYTIRYMAPPDAAGNAPTPVEYKIDPQNCGGSNVAAVTGCVQASIGFGKSFGATGSGNGQFTRPVGITTNDTHLFVADSEGGRIQIFDLDGNYAGKFGGGGGGFSSPWGITNNGTHVFVTDRSNHRVQILDINGNFIKTFGSEGIGNGEFVNPEGISTNGTHLYVVDHGRNRIQIWDTNGNFIKVSGTGGGTATAGVFDQPNGITTNGSHLFVADTHNFRIQIWDNNGNYKNQFGTAGREHGRLHHPEGIAASHNYLFIADSDTDRFQVYDFNGRFIIQQDGGFNEPRGIAVTDTRIYVTDYFNNRVLIYTLSSSFQPVDCTVGQVRNFTNSCIVDATPPVIAAPPPVSVLQNSVYRLSATVTDNDPDFDGIVRSSSNIDPFDTSSVGSFTITYTATDPARNIGTASQVITILAACPANQVPDSAGLFCVPDTMPPVITIDGNSNNRTIPVTINDFYVLPASIVTDNDQNYASSVTVTVNGTAFDATTPFDTSSAETFIVTYMANADASGNAPNPLVLTLTLAECPADREFDGNACVRPQFGHVLSFGSNGTGIGQFNTPIGITTTRTSIFIVDTFNNRVQIFDHNGNYQRQFGSAGDGNGEFNLPIGITIDNMHLYVVDFGNRRIQVFDHNGNYQRQFGSNGSANGQFYGPHHITTNSTHLYITDTANNRVQIFDNMGNHVKSFGSIGSGDGQFNQSRGITTNGTHLYITDTNNDRVQIWDINGNYVKSFGRTGHTDGLFNSPRAIASTGANLFVTDAENHRVQVYDFNNAFINHIGDTTPGSAPGLFNAPRGIATNDTHIFVADSKNNRIQIFELPSRMLIDFCVDRQIDNRTDCIPDTILPTITVSNERTFLVNATYVEPSAIISDNDPVYSGTISVTPSTINTTMPGSFPVTYTGTADIAGNIPTPVTINIIIQCPSDLESNGTACVPFVAKHILTINMTGDANFFQPARIATNNTHVFVVDRSNSVTTFDINGNFVSKFGEFGTGNGQFNRPHGITTTPDHIFIADTDNHRVQVFDHNGNYVRQFGSMGTANGEFRNPQGITTNGTHLFVVDQSNHRVQIFNVAGNHVKTFGSNGCGAGQFNQPSGITTDGIRLFVTEDNGANLQIFDVNGNHVKTIGRCVASTADGAFNGPSGLITTSTHIYVANTKNDRIEIFDINGNYVEQFGSLGTADGQFKKPRGITTNYTHLFVADTENARVQIFQLSSNLISCPTGQIFDGVACYTPEAFEFAGIRPTYLVGEPFTGTLGFPSGITATYTITDGALDGITLNNNGTWNAQLLTSANLGNHTIQITAAYQVNGADREFVESFSFNVIEACTDVQLFNGTACFEFAAKPVLSFGSGIGSADGEFSSPLEIIANGTHLFVVDTGNHRVQIFDNVGNFVAKFGPNIGFADGEFQFPSGITTNGTHFYIADTLNDRVQIFDNSSTYVAQFGGSGTGAGQFDAPERIVTNNTHLYITDTDNHRVQIFDVTGNHVKSFGSEGNSTGQFNSPSGIATNTTHLFIADTGNHRVQIFDVTGNHVKTFGSEGDGAGQFNTLAGITTTPTHIYIADNWNNRIQIFDINGEYVDQFGSLGTGVGEFKFPQGITTNGTHLYISDTSNHRVQIFEIAPNLISCLVDQIIDNTNSCTVDTIPPTITVSNERTFLVGATYVEPSANVTDNDKLYSGTITTTPSSINTTSPGTFNVTYTATADASGNVPTPVTVTVTVTLCAARQVIDAATSNCIVDTTPPTITASYTSIELEIDDPFTPPTVTLSDNDRAYSGTLTNSTTPSPIDTSSIGVFTITYEAPADASRNGPVTVNVTVNVVDTTRPVITVDGNVTNRTVTVTAGEPYTVPAGNVTDNDPAYIESVMADPSTISTSIVGIFNITYTALADASGNSALPVVISVNVTADTILPVITVGESSENRTVTVTAGEPYTVPVGNVTDNDQAYIESVMADPSTISTASLGTFTITYTANPDAAGNEPLPVVLTVHVSCLDAQLFNGNSCVEALDHVLSFGSQGNGTLQFNDPHGIAINDTHIFIVEFSNNRVQVYDHNGNYANTIGTGSASSADGEFNGPIGITTNNTHIFVADFRNHRIQIFDNSGTFVSKFGTGSAGSADGQFSSPQRITTNGTHLFVADTGNNRIQIFDIDGTFVSKFGTGSAGSADGQFNQPQGITATRTHLFIADTNNNRVQIFDINGTFVSKFGASGSGNGAFSGPRAITSTDTYIFVVDSGNNRIQIFDHDGTYVSKLGGPNAGAVNTQFDRPAAITTNNTHVLVADTGNHRVQIFTLPSILIPCEGDQVRDTTGTCIEDTEPPRIIVTPQNITLQVGDTFVPPTVTISDNDFAYAGIVTADPNTINTTSTGNFTITYSAPPDASGNTPVSVVFTATVEIVRTPDTTRPVITVDESSENRTVTAQIGEPYTVPTGTVTDNDDDYSESVTATPNTINTNNAGEFTIIYSASADAAGNTPVTVVLTVNVTDTAAPTIEASSTSITLQIGQTFTPPTVNVTDNDPSYVGIVTNTTSPSPIDTSSAGTFTITYNAPVDAAGNVPATVEVTVTVTACNTNQIIDPVTNTCVVDTERPVIMVTYTEITLQVGDTYTPPTATISDNNPDYVGTITNSTTPSPIDTSSVGAFTITYNAPADAADNEPVPVTVTVTVIDTTAPTIRVDPTSITLQIGQTFTPPTVNLTDNDPAYVGIVTNSTLPSDVDTSSAGTFTITYNAPVDAAGNVPATVEVTVTVTACTAGQVIGAATSTCIVDTTPPRITASYTSIELEIDDPFTPPIVTLSDNDQAYSGTLTNSTSPSAVDTSSIGVFTITYEAPADASNNGPVTVTVTVEIVDNDAPTITVTPTTITLQMGQPFTPPTVTIADNDPAYAGIVNADPSTINTASPGIFTITYSAPPDASRNTPTPVTVTVIVTACETNEIIDPVTNTCIVDTEPPVITVSSNHIILLTDTTYIEPIVTVSDNNPSYFENITSAPTPGPVDTSSAGNYTITYTALDDAAGNSPIPVEVIIEVVAQCPRDTVEDHFRTCIIDTSPPIIIVPGSLSVTVLVDANYTLPNATVSDNAISYNETVTSVGTVDTSVIGLYTITYMANADASGNTPATVTLTVTVATECPTGQMPNDDDVCFVPRTSGGSSSDWKTKPTFGLSWENNQPFVSGGFTLNDYTLDITNNWHTSFVPVNGVIGKENNAKIKVYAPKGLNTVMLSLGVPEVGKINDAETNIIVSILPNYTGTISYVIAEITHEQKDSLVDETQTTATLSKSLCNDSDIIEKCYTVDINFVVLAPLKSDPIALAAIDTKNRYTTTYINEGLTFTGNSMLEPATAQLVVKKGNQYDAETIDLIQQDRRHNLWEDQYGNLWTQNDHDTWIQLTFPENTPTDSYVNVMTRMHSAFDSRIDVHTQNMESIRDSMFKDVYTESDSDDP